MARLTFARASGSLATFALLALAAPAMGQPAAGHAAAPDKFPALRAGGAAGAVADTAPALPANPVPTPSVAPAAPNVAPAGEPAAPAPAEAAAPTAPTPAPGTTVAPPTSLPVAASPDPALTPLPPVEGGEHGATMHAGAGHEGGEHAEHGGPVIENWWSWDYGPGPGKAHHHPPFGFALLNFGIFLAIMFRLFGKSFRDFLQTRHSDVRRALDRAREVQAQAEAQLKQIEERGRNAEAELAELAASFRKQAEAERQAIVQRAEAEAAGLLRDAESQAQAAIASARQALERKAALLAVDLAEKLIRSRIADGDQRRLSDEYLTELEGIAHRAEVATAAARKEAP